MNGGKEDPKKDQLYITLDQPPKCTKMKRLLRVRAQETAESFARVRDVYVSAVKCDWID